MNIIDNTIPWQRFDDLMDGLRDDLQYIGETLYDIQRGAKKDVNIAGLVRSAAVCLSNTPELRKVISVLPLTAESCSNRVTIGFPCPEQIEVRLHGGHSIEETQKFVFNREDL